MECFFYVFFELIYPALTGDKTPSQNLEKAKKLGGGRAD